MSEAAVVKVAELGRGCPAALCAGLLMLISVICLAGLVLPACPAHHSTTAPMLHAVCFSDHFLVCVPSSEE